jgi:hypothetical protein
MVQRVLRWYIGQGELRSLNMVQRILRWYIGQCERRSLKYGAKHPRVVHWAMWATKFKIWTLPNVPPKDALHHILNFLAHLAQCTTWGPLAPYLNCVAHIAQCTTWGCFAPYLYIRQCELRNLKYGAKQPQVIHWAMWA